MPVYETPIHRAEEAKLLRTFCTLNGLSYVKTIGFSAFDAYLLKDGRRYAIAEVKIRKWRADYPTLMVSKSKLDTMARCAKAEGLFAFLLVDVTAPKPFRGKYAFTKEDLKKIPVDVMLRMDRNDPNDTEICYAIPVDKFERF